MTDWVIVDSGLKGVGGHNFTYTQIVRDAFRERGIDPLVLASVAVPADLASRFSLRPSFERGAYDFPTPGTWSNLRAWRRWAVAFERELGAAMPSNVKNVFSHTLGEFELEAWTRFARRLPAKATLTLLFRTTPAYLQMTWWKRRIHPYFRHRPACLRSLHALLGHRFRAATDSEELSADLRSVYAGTVETLPIPIDPLVKATSRESSKWHSTSLTLGYLGDARSAKGFDLLPKVARAILPSPHVRFLLQCVSPGDTPSPAFVEARTLLRQFEAEGRGVQLIEQRVTREDYAALLAAMDIVVVPYTARGYRESTSGIFAEAVVTGKPVVVPSETWMAAELARGEGAGVTYSRHEQNGLVGACRDAVKRYGALLEQARSRAGRYGDRHSPGALVDQLIDGARA